MSGGTVGLVEPEAGVFAPFGDLVVPPDTHGARRFYSDSLVERTAGSAPVLHVNSVKARSLPLRVERVERHPFAAQCFFPLDVSRYVVLVMPSDGDGRPVPEDALALLLPGNMGVIFNAGVWHMGATVLDRDGHFTVLMWRGAAEGDDEFREIPPLTLVAP